MRLRRKIGQLLVRLAEKFDDEARYAIAQPEGAHQQAGPPARAGFPEQQHQHRAQHNALQPCFVQLAGVASDTTRLAVVYCVCYTLLDVTEYHRPRHICASRAAPQLAVDEIGAAAKEQPETHAGRDIIAHPQKVQPIPPANPRNRQHHADQPAVKAHAPLPQLDHLAGVRPQAGDAGGAAGVKGRIAEPPPQNDPHGAIKEQILGMALGQRRAGLADFLGHMPERGDDPQQIGQRIIAQREEMQIDPALQPQIGPQDRRVDGAGCCG